MIRVPFLRFSILLVIVTVVLVPASVRGNELLKIGVYQNSPKIFLNRDGTADGILVDYLREIAQLEGWSLTFIPCDWSECLALLEDGKLDIMPDVAYNEERARLFAFHREPALHSWLQVYSRPDVDISSLLDLQGKRVAVLNDSVQALALAQVQDGFGIRIVMQLADSFEEAFAAVSEDRADAVIANHFYGDQHSSEFGVRRTPIMFQPNRLFFAAPLGQHAEVLGRIDHHLVRWKADTDSLYYQSIERWTGERPRTVIPRNLLQAIAVVSGLLLLTMIAVVVLRWQVAVRTSSLVARNAHLSEVLEELKFTREKAIEQERLHVLGQMASGIAHDFNNSLMLILGHAELLLDAIAGETDTKQELIAQIHVIEQAGRDASAIVQRMREFYRQRQVEEPTENVRLDQLAQDCIVLTRPRWDGQALAAGATILVEQELVPVPTVSARRFEVREAVLNLMLNAVDAMPKGGVLTLRTGVSERYSFVEVADTGIGMSEAVMQDCLRPFFTTKELTGTGMGLSMVASVMERCDGKITISSNEGQGSCFRLLFPLTSSSAEPLNASDDLPVAIRHLSILVVDDNAQMLGIVTSMFMADGHRVQGAISGADALSLVGLRSFDVAFLDFAMPEMTGASLAVSLRAQGFRGRIVTLTGAADHLNEQQLRCFDHVVSKPVGREQLRAVLQELGFGEDRGTN